VTASFVFKNVRTFFKTFENRGCFCQGRAHRRATVRRTNSKSEFPMLTPDVAEEVAEEDTVTPDVAEEDPDAPGQAKAELEAEAKASTEAKLKAAAEAQQQREAEGRKKSGPPAAPPSTTPEPKAQKNSIAPVPVAPVAHCGGPYTFEMDRVLPLNEVAVLVGLSQDSLRRHYRHLFLHLSPRRVGIRMRDVLNIGRSNPNPSTAA
jgi:hypothetical protein